MPIAYYVMATCVALAGFIFAYPATRKPNPSTWNAGEKLGLMAMAAGMVLVLVGELL